MSEFEKQLIQTMKLAHLTNTHKKKFNAVVATLKPCCGTENPEYLACQILKEIEDTRHTSICGWAIDGPDRIVFGVIYENQDEAEKGAAMYRFTGKDYNTVRIGIRKEIK